MYYIIMDLEWNQSPLGRESQEKAIPFEIIEIGAVKLNSEREIIDEFREIICPQVYQEIHSKTKEIIQLDMETLNKGISFREAAIKFFEWCGTDYSFCTWGSMDLTELQRNLDYYDLREYMHGCIKYYDIQKLFSLCYEGKKNPRTLSYAIDFLNIESREDFHRALYDAKYTAQIFKLLDMEVVNKYYSLDYYHNPKTKEEEIHIIYDDYSKYVSREFKTKEIAFEEKEVKDLVCFLCGKAVPKKIRWFTNNSKIYYSLGFCKDHGYIKGKIRIKKSVSEQYFVVKTVKVIESDVAESLRMKHDEIKCKKKYKKNRRKTAPQ